MIGISAVAGRISAKFTNVKALFDMNARPWPAEGRLKWEGKNGGLRAVPPVGSRGNPKASSGRFGGESTPRKLTTLFCKNMFYLVAVLGCMRA